LSEFCRSCAAKAEVPLARYQMLEKTSRIRDNKKLLMNDIERRSSSYEIFGNGIFLRIDSSRLASSLTIAAVNPEIASIIQNISKENVEAILKNLESFQTRHTLLSFFLQ
jgi:hypothetical protein